MLNYLFFLSVLGAIVILIFFFLQNQQFLPGWTARQMGFFGHGRQGVILCEGSASENTCCTEIRACQMLHVFSDAAPYVNVAF